MEITHSGTAERDLFGMICGDVIGEGQYRTVYTYLPDPATYVIKLENESKAFSNIREWDIWTRSPEHVRKWLAPCVDISPAGVWLVQRRTLPIRKLPKRLPVWMTDIKLANFGEIDGKVVCHDYGNNLLYETAPKKTKRVKNVYPRA